jgi:hypothetical protein
MNHWINEQIARERYIDMVHEERQRHLVALVVAARRRAARSRLGASRRNARFYGLLLARLGRRMAAWGCGLEARYGPIVEPQIAVNTGGNITNC